MFKGVSNVDMSQMFSNSLVLNHGRLVFLGDLYGKGFESFDLETQRPFTIPRDDWFFMPVDRHIGMVNTEIGCGFISRKVIRQYSVGLTHGNIQVNSSSGLVDMELKRLKNRGIVTAYKDEYPELQKAFELAVANSLFYAFDKSFAVDQYGNVYYKKMKRVGEYVKGKINFVKGVEFLAHRIGGSNGKNYQPV